ncbi:MAG: hypothetical protein L3K10_04005 [Thermoplasmata archaeon]|nr:hypothetical protein [Thermoplasmata archaeon]
MSDSEGSHRVDHIVVAMFENRSFDNLLGYLYRPGEVPAFEGVVGRNLSNPIPEYALLADRHQVPVHPTEKMGTPDPDPGEEYPHVNTQIYGGVTPEANRLKGSEEMEPPFNAPSDPRVPPTMDGFVADYINTLQVTRGRPPRFDEYSQIMGCYTPAQLPVTSTLAKGFACFDHWFCEVPSQTYANRSFFHAASSSGFVLNGPIGNFPLHNDAETIFERLEAAGVSWRVYFHPLQCVSATGLIHAPRLARYFATHFFSIDDFIVDAARGKLPAYAFIEPSLIPPHTDMHPPGDTRLRRLLSFLPKPTSVHGGESLFARIYEAIRTSASATGSNFENTLLLATFDEHGGTYDHVPPPRVPPPDPKATAGQMGFRFDRSGVRVPTIAISAWIDPRTVVNAEYRATSVIRTLRERWSLGPPLTGRDAVAADIAPLLTRSTPRPPAEWPRVAVPPLPRLGLLEAVFTPLPALGRDLFGAALSYESQKTGRATRLNLGRASHWRARRYVRRLRSVSFVRAHTRSRR